MRVEGSSRQARNDTSHLNETKGICITTSVAKWVSGRLPAMRNGQRNLNRQLWNSVKFLNNSTDNDIQEQIVHNEPEEEQKDESSLSKTA